MSPDPLAGDRRFPQSLNHYSYVMNNPLNATDPTGMDLQYNDHCSVAPGGCTKWPKGMGPNNPENPKPKGWCKGNCHDFTGGTEKERKKAYEEQEKLRKSLTKKAKDEYRRNYGRDLDEDLKPGHGTTVDLTDLNGKWGQYDGSGNDISIDKDVLNDSTLFGATLLHETGHFGADMATIWGSKNPTVDASTKAVIMEAVSRSPFRLFTYYFTEHDSGYSMEVWQYGTVPTVP